eukprot:11005851-Karenia_brevis.AAC.1
MAEASDEILKIPEDDRNREYKLHRAKLEVLLKTRFNHDINQGMTWREARTRQQHRMRISMRLAVSKGL